VIIRRHKHSAAALACAGSLKPAIRRVGILNVAIPYHEAEGEFVAPTAAKIIAAVKSVLGN
jgi:pyruvate/2-oxoglutarate/acetoin dehydrogenase E1 component